MWASGALGCFAFAVMSRSDRVLRRNSAWRLRCKKGCTTYKMQTAEPDSCPFVCLCILNSSVLRTTHFLGGQIQEDCGKSWNCSMGGSIAGRQSGPTSQDPRSHPATTSHLSEAGFDQSVPPQGQEPHHVRKAAGHTGFVAISDEIERASQNTPFCYFVPTTRWQNG